ncbi:MAG: hypothetical protein AAGF22_00485 [Pseudomonadota bacterium]
MTRGTTLRFTLCIIGALAGLAYYALLDERVLRATPVEVQRVAIYWVIALFPAFGLMAGPIRIRRAAVLSFSLATLMASLVTWAGGRFDSSFAGPLDVLEPTGHGLFLIPYVLLTAMFVPVLTASAKVPEDWKNYRPLFALAWNAAVKALVAVLFLALFWGVYFLSDALLQLARIDTLEQVIDTEYGPYLLSGAVVGIALAVTTELDRVVDTLLGLVLRLLRLLLVPVASVLALFVIATVFQGLEEVFQRTSAAATMIAMAAGAIILVAAGLDADDDVATHNLALIWATRMLAFALPLIASVACYALWLRVDQYGWTPTRIAAALSAFIVVLYVLPVTLNGINASPGWQRRTRQGFVWATIITSVLGALWFTPVLNAQRIASASQTARLIDGRIEAQGYDFWPLAREWGVAGRAAMAALRTHGFSQEVIVAMDGAETADTRYASQQVAQSFTAAESWSELLDVMPTFPISAQLPDYEQLTQPFRPLDPTLILRNCNSEAAGGGLRCIATQAEMILDAPGPEWLIVTQSRPGGTSLSWVLWREDEDTWSWRHLGTTRRPGGDRDVIRELRSGAFGLVTPQIQGVQVGDAVFMPPIEGR